MDRRLSNSRTPRQKAMGAWRRRPNAPGRLGSLNNRRRIWPRDRSWSGFDASIGTGEGFRQHAKAAALILDG